MRKDKSGNRLPSVGRTFAILSVWIPFAFGNFLLGSLSILEGKAEHLLTVNLLVLIAVGIILNLVAVRAGIGFGRRSGRTRDGHTEDEE